MTALTAAQLLADGICDLSDSSVAGDWRLPSVNEFQSLSDYEYTYPALSNGAGTGQWTEGDVFWNVKSNEYWSSTSVANQPWRAWDVNFAGGSAYTLRAKSLTFVYVWPVRGGL